MDVGPYRVRDDSEIIRDPSFPCGRLTGPDSSPNQRSVSLFVRHPLRGGKRGISLPPKGWSLIPEPTQGTSPTRRIWSVFCTNDDRGTPDTDRGRRETQSQRGEKLTLRPTCSTRTPRDTLLDIGPWSLPSDTVVPDTSDRNDDLKVTLTIYL